MNPLAPKWDPQALENLPVPHKIGATDGWLYAEMFSEEVDWFVNKFSTFLNEFKNEANGAFALFRGWDAMAQALYRLPQRAIGADFETIDEGDPQHRFERIDQVVPGGWKVYEATHV